MTAATSERLVNASAVRLARSALPSHDLIQSVGTYFRMLGDPTRLRILYSLERGELCVGDIVAVLGLTASAISHQLALLKGEHLVKSRREGQAVYYALSDDHVASILRTIQEHVAEHR